MRPVAEIVAVVDAAWRARPDGSPWEHAMLSVSADGGWCMLDVSTCTRDARPVRWTKHVHFATDASNADLEALIGSAVDLVQRAAIGHVDDAAHALVDVDPGSQSWRPVYQRPL